MKKCSQCQIFKQSLYFSKDKRAKDGFKSECSKCHYQVWNEQDKKRSKEWHKIHPLYARIKSKEYKLRYPEKWSLINRMQRHKRRALGKIDYNTWLIKINNLGRKCQLCFRPESEVKLTIDHIIPVSKGGANNIENLQPLCFSCNRTKFNHILS